MTDSELITRLKTVHVSGTMRGPDWLNDLATQAAQTATECDSAFHETVAITLRRAAAELLRQREAFGEIESTLRYLRHA